MTTLLERAMQIQRRVKSPRVDTGKEMQDLAIAWIKGDVSLGQINKVLQYGNSAGGKSLYRIAVAIRQAYLDGRVTFTD